MRKVGTIFLAAILCAVGAIKAHADSISLSLTPVSKSAGPGSTVLFTGTLSAAGTNTGNVYLNADDFTLSGPFQLDDTAFLQNFPLFLLPGQSVTATLFTVFTSANSKTGTFSGKFSVLGGSSDSDYSLLASQNFSVTVTPEPCSLLLLGTGLIGTFAASRHRFVTRKGVTA